METTEECEKIEKDINDLSIQFKTKGCDKSKALAVPKKEKEPKAKVTLHGFGIYTGKRSRDLYSVQGYIEKKTPEGYQMIRHFHYSTIAGQSGYKEGFKTLSYEIPENRRIYLETTTNSKRHNTAYFITDKKVKKSYCQDVVIPKEDVDACISGNIIQLNMQEAKERGFKPTGTFKMWKEKQGTPKELSKK